MTEDKHLQNFIEETEDMLRSLHERLAGLTVGADNTEIINEVFRVVHTIKGNASFFGFAGLKYTANSLEDFLSEVRSNSAPIDKHIIDLLWNGINLIALNMEHVKAGQAPAGATPAEEAFVSEVKKILSERAVLTKIVSRNYRMQDSVGYLCGEADITRPVYIVRGFLEKARMQALDGDINAKFVDTLSVLAEVFLKNGCQQASDISKKMSSDMDTLINDDGQAGDFLLGSLEEDFKKLLGYIREVEIRDITSAWREIRPPVEKVRPSFRIDKEKIDEILAAVRKLDTIKNEFSGLRDKMARSGVENSVLLEFQKALNSFNFCSRDILQLIIKMKVTSPRLLLEKMEQIVALLALSCSKKIKIDTMGKDIFIDRGKIEILEKVLPHIVRNCIDHGIETPEERIRLGKAEEGRISIEASKNNESLVISIADDGKGIDEAALNKENGASSPSDKKNIFAPGVSSRQFVSELSGRGVGMDVVLRALEKVGGELEVFSEAGQGTRFVITLPEEAF
ncbi:MAG TPA: hypothetical protein DCL35_07115 [Candidatus Omnitrophica bacterium]|nr:hypothetical protein [Candidatus Omnitrophota bacterium]